MNTLNFGLKVKLAMEFVLIFIGVLKGTHLPAVVSEKTQTGVRILEDNHGESHWRKVLILLFPGKILTNNK